MGRRQRNDGVCDDAAPTDAVSQAIGFKGRFPHYDCVWDDDASLTPITR